jgi:hypothetical protein
MRKSLFAVLVSLTLPLSACGSSRQPEANMTALNESRSRAAQTCDTVKVGMTLGEMMPLCSYRVPETGEMIFAPDFWNDTVETGRLESKIVFRWLNGSTNYIFIDHAGRVTGAQHSVTATQPCDLRPPLLCSSYGFFF